jgi:hypothetical protein
MIHKPVSNGARARRCFAVLLRQVQKSIDAWRRFIFLGPAHPAVLPSGTRFWDLSTTCDAWQLLVMGRREPHFPPLFQVFFGCTYIAPWDSDSLSHYCGLGSIPLISRGLEKKEPLAHGERDYLWRYAGACIVASLLLLRRELLAHVAAFGFAEVLTIA